MTRAKKSNRRNKQSRKDEELIQDKSIETVAPIVKKLKLEDPNERAWAATTIAHLILEHETSKQLMAAGVIEALSSCIQDDHPKVVLEALGAIRNSLMAVGSEACIKLLQANGLQLLLNLIPKLISAIQSKIDVVSNEEVDENAVDPFNITEQTVACLWSLTEVSDEATRLLTSSDMLAFLISILSSPHSPWPLIRVTGQILNTLSDENEEICLLFKQNNDYSKTITSIAQNVEVGTFDDDSRLEIRVLCASILHNISSILNPCDQFAMYQMIMSVVGEALTFDLIALLPQINNASLALEQATKSVVPNEAAEKVGDLDMFKPENKNTQYLQSVESHISTVQLTLELLTNIYSEDVVEENWQENEEDDQMEGDYDKIMDEMITSIEEDFSDNGIVGQLGKFLFAGTNNIFIQLVRFATLTLPPNSSEYSKKIYSSAEQLQIRALSSLNNIFLVGVADDWIKSNITDVHSLWTTLCYAAFQISSLTPVPIELFEIFIIFIWSFVRTVYKVQVTISPTEEQVTWMLQGASINSGTTETIQVKVVGILSCLAQKKGSIELNKVIGQWMMEQLMIASSAPGMQYAELLSEILNAIFDIYADGNFDYDVPVFVNLNFNQILSDNISKIQQKFKNVDKRKHRQLRERVDESFINLKAFIKYKHKEQCK